MYRMIGAQKDRHKGYGNSKAIVISDHKIIFFEFSFRNWTNGPLFMLYFTLG